MINNHNVKQLTIFLLVGGVSAIIDLTLLYLLVELLSVNYLVAAAFSIILLSIVAFFVHRKYTFSFQGGQLGRRYILYLVTLLSGLLLSLILLYLFVENFGIWYIYSSIITKLIILFWNFVINKFFIFKSRSGETSILADK